MVAFSRSVVSVLILLFICHSGNSFTKFECKNKGGGAPKLPQAYSTNIRINFLDQQYTVEMNYATNKEGGKEIIEFQKHDRHVMYIRRGDQKSSLFIQYRKDAHPTCKFTKSGDRKDFFQSEDSGPSNILLKALEVMLAPDTHDVYSISTSTETGLHATRYEGCLTDLGINISMTFAAKDWKMPHISSLVKNVSYPDMVVVDDGKSMITALYSYFDPTVPDDAVFQPPADVYCDGFRADKTPPKMTDYFSYGAEMIMYESAMGIAPTVSDMEVYYDYPARISRIDFNNPYARDSDLFSEITAQKRSIIHDFNAGVQYIFDPFTGQCTTDTIDSRFSAISTEETKDNTMLKGIEYFWLDDLKTSYNGQFPIRGMMADVYTALRVNPQTKKSQIISWYFSTDETRLVESENVEKNVLLRMYVRPETDLDKEDVVEVNFYNFAKEEPDVFTYDLTSCYNDTSSKTLVFTFPGIDSLRGSEKLIGMLIHLAIKNTTGVAKQRIYMKEVIFSGGYMYGEFSLLEKSPIKREDSSKEISLEDALKKLQKSVSTGSFIVNVPSGKNVITLKPQPNGLNVFAGDRVRKPQETGYREGSVVSLTIGMLILGFLLGGVTLNLIISKKFGVSLFQKSSYDKGFSNPLNESSM